MRSLRYLAIGDQGSTDYVILRQRPFYLTVRTPWLFDRAFRIRLFGGRVEFQAHRRLRCEACRKVIQNDHAGPCCV